MDVFRTDRIRNVVLLGHGGAGKTTLAEAMAYLAGMTNRLGRVEDGNTVSDYDKEEIKRHFSISTTLIPVPWDKVKINVLDTPGYFDFVGEVEEAVSAADAAIIVVSGKAGVQVGTQKAWNLCEKYKLPRMIFVTDMDVDDVSYRKVVEQLTELYGKKIAPLHFPIREDGKFVGYVNVVKQAGRKYIDKGKKEECPIPEYLDEYLEKYHDILMESVAETSEEFMDRYFEGDTFSVTEVSAALAMNVQEASIVPVCMGSPINLRGVSNLLDDICGYFPSPDKRSCNGISQKTNEIFEAKISVGKNLSVSKKPIKGHILSQAYLSLIFNHTTSEYFHEKGCVFGRSIYSGMPVTFDPFDKTHFSYGAVIAGQSGYGKSATVKQLFSRQVDFGVHIANIDYEPLPGDGKRGEYSIVAEAVGGVNYLISNYSDSQLNFFEISDEYEYNRATGEEIPTLYLEEKIVDMTNILMVLATSFTTNGMVGEFEPTEYSRIKSIISKNVRKIYADCGLRDKDAASLYETVPASGGSFGSGRRKKRLPQMHDFYRAILLDARENTDSFKENAFSLLLDIFEDRVREMYYCPHCMKEFTREELSTLKRTEGGVHICNNHEEGKIYYLREIHGSQAYLDCQSTLSIDMSLPFHNFDLSQITDETERINMIMVVQSYIEENFIKKNSTNPNKAKKLIVSTDEAHRILKFEGARMFENALYRVARKRHTAPWLILQSVKDFAKYQDTEEILKSTETFMLFRHNYLDGQYIKDTTNLNQSQVDTVLNLGGTSEAKKYGELCLVDIPTKRAVFIQADYLKDSEFDVVETDVEKIAEHARMKQGA